MKFLALLAISAIAASAQVLNPERAIREVTDRVYVATGYALGNMIYVITDKSLVAVDTTESPRAAKATLDDFHRTTNMANLPVSYIVYTHFHGDHSNGAKVFKTLAAKIVAQR